jgi:hypothetical protein
VHPIPPGSYKIVASTIYCDAGAATPTDLMNKQGLTEFTTCGYRVTFLASNTLPLGGTPIVGVASFTNVSGKLDVTIKCPPPGKTVNGGVYRIDGTTLLIPELPGGRYVPKALVTGAPLMSSVRATKGFAFPSD